MNESERKEYYFLRDQKRHDRFRSIIREAKDRSCADCGHKYPPCVMDFDHREPEKKVRKVSDLRDFSSEIKLREEIAKCDVICANCHRIRTHNRSEGSEVIK